MSSILRNTALSLLAAAALSLPAAAFADSAPPPPGQAPAADQTGSKPPAISTQEMNKDFQSLSPETRKALMKQLQEKGVRGISNMSESDARSTFENLPPDVKAQLQAKWDALSDEQREAIKKMGAGAIEQMVESKIKDMVKPSQAISDAGHAIIDKGKDMIQKGRGFLRRLWLQFTGGSDDSQGDGATGA